MTVLLREGYLEVVGYLAHGQNPVDRLVCGHVVPCSRNGATDPHSERCDSCYLDRRITAR